MIATKSSGLFLLEYHPLHVISAFRFRSSSFFLRFWSRACRSFAMIADATERLATEKAAGTNPTAFVNSGVAEGTRTPDPRNHNPML